MTAAPVSAEFRHEFLARADDRHAMTFATFMELALYHPVIGYYRRPRTRVGFAPGTDFFTASSSGAVFGELVAAACVKLLGPHNPADYTFVEIGAEPGGGVLNGVSHPFAEAKTIRVGDPLDLSGQCIVFSNELFDAQPFRRFRFRGGVWVELGVQLRDDGLTEIELASTPPSGEFPPHPIEGYVIDTPFAASALAAKIAAQPWTGLFVASDYGKSWQELFGATPQGTARAYFRHTQNNELLARAGEQDLTCHVCWDWLTDALRQHGFASPQLESQESFFIRHAESYIAPAIAADAARFTPRKQALMQLLHGAHLGLKFQVLHGLRLREGDPLASVAGS